MPQGWRAKRGETSGGYCRVFAGWTSKPNHNPLIQEQPADTLDDVHAAMRLLIRLLLETERMELNYSERETRGLLSVMECLTDAMKFELYHRGDDK